MVQTTSLELKVLMVFGAELRVSSEVAQNTTLNSTPLWPKGDGIGQCLQRPCHPPPRDLFITGL